MKIMIRVIQSNDLTANKYIKGIIGVCRFYRLLLGTACNHLCSSDDCNNEDSYKPNQKNKNNEYE